MSSLHDLPELLHDARLLHTSWDRDCGELRMTFQTLRRNPAGGRLDDNHVTLRFLDLDAFFGIRRYLDLEWNLWMVCEKQPSTPEVFAELNPMPPAPPPEVFVSINSAADSFELSECPNFTRTFAPEQSRYDRQPVRFRMTTGTRSTQDVYIGCRDIEITSAGKPLSLEQWMAEHEAHWKQWRAYWAARDEEEDGDELDFEESGPRFDDDELDDAFDEHDDAADEELVGEGAADLDDDDRDFSVAIPSADEDASRFEGYVPPARPPFVAGDTDIPDELREPLQAWFEALHRQDWATMARVAPGNDRSFEDQCDFFETAYTESWAGKWNYVTAIKKWQIVGRRAYVLMDGIDHYAPGVDEPGDPSADLPSQFSAELWHWDGRWFIRTLSGV